MFRYGFSKFEFEKNRMKKIIFLFKNGHWGRNPGARPTRTVRAHLSWPTTSERGPSWLAEAAHEAACLRVAKACTSATPTRGSRVERWLWRGCWLAKADRLSIRSCRWQPLDIIDPTREGFEDQLEPDSNDNERVVLTGGDALSSPEQRRALASGGWGGITEAGRSSGTCARGWEAGEAARH
jgi:hypothetical protein